MRLQSIRLHPFGRHADAAIDLAKPLVVIHGPNETGKTTLRQAIVHALFTPTSLTPTQFRKTVQPWLPLPGGDHAAVTLAFTHRGSPWMLEKRWGAGQASRLSDGTSTIADPVAVQKRLAEMLIHSEATYRHVLFTGQAELERTLHAIADHAAELEDIRDILKAGGDADVDEQRLRRALDERIEAAFGRWNDTTCRPDRQAGQEKDLGNRWINGVGAILRAWYAWQEFVGEHEQLLALERAIDGIGREVIDLEKRAATAAAFVKQHGHLRAALNERRVLDERLSRLQQSVESLGTTYRSWPAAEAAIKAWAMRRAEFEEQRDGLQAELAAARKREEGAALHEAFARLRIARLTWEEADAAAKRLPDPGPDRIASIQALDDAIVGAEQKLRARTLSWRIEATDRSPVSITRGIEPAETMTVGPAGASGSAEGRVRLAASGISLTVDSGGDDVEALLLSLADNRRRLLEELGLIRANTPADARLMADKRREAEALVKEHEARYTGALGDRSFEQWAALIKELDDLPSTREVEAIEGELDAIRTRLAEGKTVADNHRRSIDEWMQAYGTLDALEEKLLDAKATAKEAKARHESLDTLPEGFDSPHALLAKLDDAQSDQLLAQSLLTEKKAACVELMTRLGDRRSQDVAELADAARRKFERARAEGRNYRRIRQEIDRIAATAADDPLHELGQRVGELVSRITGAATAIHFEGQVPATVVRGAVSLAPDRLSHGGCGALALAVRLAMAEAYIGDGDGFVMLDDPLVHFDTERMTAAADILRRFSGTKQVIFFTCHDHHAARLEGHAVGGA